MCLCSVFQFHRSTYVYVQSVSSTHLLPRFNYLLPSVPFILFELFSSCTFLSSYLLLLFLLLFFIVIIIVTSLPDILSFSVPFRICFCVVFLMQSSHSYVLFCIIKRYSLKKNVLCKEGRCVVFLTHLYCSANPACV